MAIARSILGSVGAITARALVEKHVIVTEDGRLGGVSVWRSRAAAPNALSGTIAGRRR
jgi:hypothetical protein